MVTTEYLVLIGVVIFLCGTSLLAMIANLVARDMGSTTGMNLALVREETWLNPRVATLAKVRERLDTAVQWYQD